MKYYLGGLLTIVFVFPILSLQLKEISPEKLESTNDNTNWVWENPVTFKNYQFHQHGKEWRGREQKKRFSH